MARTSNTNRASGTEDTGAGTTGTNESKKEWEVAPGQAVRTADGVAREGEIVSLTAKQAEDLSDRRKIITVTEEAKKRRSESRKERQRRIDADADFAAKANPTPGQPVVSTGLNDGSVRGIGTGSRADDLARQAKDANAAKVVTGADVSGNTSTTDTASTGTQDGAGQGTGDGGSNTGAGAGNDLSGGTGGAGTTNGTN